MNLLTATLFCCALAAADASADSLADRMRACSKHEDRDQRLACFDAEVARLPAAPAPEAKFGERSRAVARQKGKDTQTPDRIEATVTGVTNRAHGQLVLTLDNGQVWEQTETRPELSLSVGDKVIIQAGAFTSYRLVTAAGRSAKVTRVE